MSFLNIFCPVKVFGYAVQGEHRNSVAAIVGSAVAATSFSGYFILQRVGAKEWIKPSFILGCAGVAAAVLGLENKRLCRAKIPEPKIDENEITTAIEYLTTYYWMFWEEKIKNESNTRMERIARPNIPSEFALAFGHSLLKALESKISARYEKFCEREGDEHPEKWEFRSELKELDLREKDLWTRTKAILEDFRIGPKAFNRQGDDLNLARPLLYCTLVGLLREFHPRYNKILIEARTKKLDLISQQMKPSSIKLPTISETYTKTSTTSADSGEKHDGACGGGNATEVLTEPVQVLERSGSFSWTSDEPVVVDKYAPFPAEEQLGACGGSASAENGAEPIQVPERSGSFSWTSDEPAMVDRQRLNLVDDEPQLSPRRYMRR